MTEETAKSHFMYDDDGKISGAWIFEGNKITHMMPDNESIIYEIDNANIPAIVIEKFGLNNKKTSDEKLLLSGINEINSSATQLVSRDPRIRLRAEQNIILHDKIKKIEEEKIASDEKKRIEKIASDEKKRIEKEKIASDKKIAFLNKLKSRGIEIPKEKNNNKRKIENIEETEILSLVSPIKKTKTQSNLTCNDGRSVDSRRDNKRSVDSRYDNHFRYSDFLDKISRGTLRIYNFNEYSEKDLINKCEFCCGYKYENTGNLKKACHNLHNCLFMCTKEECLDSQVHSIDECHNKGGRNNLNSNKLTVSCFLHKNSRVCKNYN